MKTVRFTRNTNPEKEGGPGYKAGDVAQLDDLVAARWERRSAVVLIDPQEESAPAAAADDKPVAPAPAPAGKPGRRKGA